MVATGESESRSVVSDSPSAFWVTPTRGYSGLGHSSSAVSFLPSGPGFFPPLFTLGHPCPGVAPGIDEGLFLFLPNHFFFSVFKISHTASRHYANEPSRSGVLPGVKHALISSSFLFPN